MGPGNHVLHWRHLASTTELSMCGGNAALCQISLTICYYCCLHVFCDLCCHLWFVANHHTHIRSAFYFPFPSAIHSFTSLLGGFAIGAPVSLLWQHSAKRKMCLYSVYAWLLLHCMIFSRMLFWSLIESGSDRKGITDIILQYCGADFNLRPNYDLLSICI